MTQIPVEFVGGPADGLRVTVESIDGTLFPPMFQQVSVPAPGRPGENPVPGPGPARYRRTAPRPGENYWRYLYLQETETPF